MFRYIFSSDLMNDSRKMIDFDIRCDAVEIIDSTLDADFAYETIASMWEHLLAGNSDLFTTFVSLAKFFSVAPKQEIERFCQTYSLAELWFFYRHTDQLQLQILALICLNVAIQYNNP